MKIYIHLFLTDARTILKGKEMKQRHTLHRITCTIASDTQLIGVTDKVFFYISVQFLTLLPFFKSISSSSFKVRLLTAKLF